MKTRVFQISGTWTVSNNGKTIVSRSEFQDLSLVHLTFNLMNKTGTFRATDKAKDDRFFETNLASRNQY